MTNGKSLGEKMAEVVKRDSNGKVAMTITKRSITSGKSNTMTISAVPSDYMAWRNGTLIQEAMPYLDTVEREFLISGMSRAEQAEFFDAEA